MRQGTDLQLSTEVKRIFSGNLQLCRKCKSNSLAIRERVIPDPAQMFSSGNGFQTTAAFKGPSADLCHLTLQPHGLQMRAIVAKPLRDDSHTFAQAQTLQRRFGKSATTDVG